LGSGKLTQPFSVKRLQISAPHQAPVGRASRRGSGKWKSADVERKTVTLVYPYPQLSTAERVKISISPMLASCPWDLLKFFLIFFEFQLSDFFFSLSSLFYGERERSFLTNQTFQNILKTFFRN
jgi:hypothetical protein